MSAKLSTSYREIYILTNRNIAYKLILIITICSAVIFTVTIGYFYQSSRVTLERELESNARNLVLASVNRVETGTKGPKRQNPEKEA